MEWTVLKLTLRGEDWGLHVLKNIQARGWSSSGIWGLGIWGFLQQLGEGWNMTVYQVIADVQLAKVREAPSPYMVEILFYFPVFWSGKCCYVSHIPVTILQNNVDKQRTCPQTNTNGSLLPSKWKKTENKSVTPNRENHRVWIYWRRCPGWALRHELGTCLSLLEGTKFRT